jgi:hypothetical protein
MGIFRRIFGGLSTPRSGGTRIKARNEVENAVGTLVNSLERVEHLSDAELSRLVKNRKTSRWLRFEAAYRLSATGGVGALVGLIGESSHATEAAVDGLCYAACNGEPDAVRALEHSLDGLDRTSRLRLGKGLYYVLDGTPGDLGISGASVRESARRIMLRLCADCDAEIADGARWTLNETAHVQTVKRGSDYFTYRGRRWSEETLHGKA